MRPEGSHVRSDYPPVRRSRPPPSCCCPSWPGGHGATLSEKVLWKLQHLATRLQAFLLCVTHSPPRSRRRSGSRKHLDLEGSAERHERIRRQRWRERKKNGKKTLVQHFLADCTKGLASQMLASTSLDPVDGLYAREVKTGSRQRIGEMKYTKMRDRECFCRP
ncbi:hypothetical protein NDU88_012433 [Pleurodeles waltl]|uniref:Uncharacterized protein n=1 Tax=Pleurodeles waltl TaxID=8319 RepID=A0AAV7R2T4_PLEWA|nr:hypothetical protein NDU88_012433 [Pleurodeles waltl]